LPIIYVYGLFYIDFFIYTIYSLAYGPHFCLRKTNSFFLALEILFVLFLHDQVQVTSDA